MSETSTGGALGDGDDAGLAESVREGDPHAYAALWHRHAGAGRSVARRYVRRDADADDLVAEAFARILRALRGGGGPRGEFRPYLTQTIRNIAADRTGTGAEVALDEVAELPEEGADPAESVPDDALTRRAFRSLPTRWQTVLWYVEVEGLRPDEVAPILGLTPANASALAYRAREGLRRAWLQAHVGPAELPVDCRWATERMAGAARGALSSVALRRFESHLAGCRRCSDLYEELQQLNGRLAVLILPAALGAGAVPLLVGGGGAPASADAAAPRVAARPARLALVATGVVVVLAASITGVAAATGAFSSQTPGSTAAEPAASPSPAVPEPGSHPSPTPTPEATPPGVPTDPRVPAPAVPIPAPVDRTAPTAPTVSNLADGSLLADSSPSLTGRGEPGARIQVRSGGVVGAGTVQPDGRWSVTLSALPDGVHALVVTATDAAGNRSDGVSRVVTIDTVALAPVLDPPPASPLTWLPGLTGTGEPGAVVELSDETSAVVATSAVAADGTWAVDLPDPRRDGVVLTARQTDAAGNRSPDTAPTDPISFTRPWFAGPSDGDLVPSTGGATVVTARLAGITGMQVQVFVDGVTTGNVHTLEASPIDRVTPPLPDGPHTLGVRYVDPVSGGVGSTQTVSFVIG